MGLPFSTEQFLGVFERYNQAIWPAQVVAYILGLAAILLALRPGSYSDRIISGILLIFWLWTGLAYHLSFFVEINPLATIFGAAFIAQASVWACEGIGQSHLRFRVRRDLPSVVGGACIVYAMALYPIIGGLLGHGYPRSPSFGVAPCPTTIFTFGLLLWTSVRVPIYVLAIPLLWSLIGFSAALWLGIREDIGLPIAGVLSTALLVWRDGRSLGHRASQSATPSERDVSAPAPRPERVAVRTSGSPSPSARSGDASGGASS